MSTPSRLFLWGHTQSARGGHSPDTHYESIEHPVPFLVAAPLQIHRQWRRSHMFRRIVPTPRQTAFVLRMARLAMPLCSTSEFIQPAIRAPHTSVAHPWPSERVWGRSAGMLPSASHKASDPATMSHELPSLFFHGTKPRTCLPP